MANQPPPIPDYVPTYSELRSSGQLLLSLSKIYAELSDEEPEFAQYSYAVLEVARRLARCARYIWPDETEAEINGTGHDEDSLKDIVDQLLNIQNAMNN